MKRTLPFLLVGFLSFGATHAVLKARAATIPPVRRAAPARPTPELSACRPVRVVYAGSVRPAGAACPPSP